GGGCQVGAGAGGGALSALVLVLLVAMRRRGVVFGMIAALAAGDALAQSDTSFDLRVFRPRHAQPRAFIPVAQPEVLAHLAYAVGLYVNYARNPLVADAGGGMTAAAVSDRTEMTLLGSLGLIDRLELGIAVPMIVASGSAGAGALAPASGT